MAFPDRKKTIKVLKEIEERKKKGEIIGAQMLPDNASSSDKMKFKVCRNILLIKKKYELSNEQIAELIDSNPTTVSRIINYRIDRFSFDKLMNFYEILVKSTENKKASRALKSEVENFLEQKELKYG
ncbi:MAG: hypothetical protein KAQ98_14590 [Bacteriovoracaceae bacterium]|nr:hypothetical protein [Bacteriovoracaceae bacterium]